MGISSLKSSGENLFQRKKYRLIAAVVIVALILTYASVYNVALTQQVVLTQFGKIVGEPKTEPGLYLRVPFIQKTHYLSKHLIYKWESELVQARSFDSEFLYFKSLVVWEVGDPIKYFQKANKVNIADVFEDEVLSVVRITLSSYTVSEIFEAYSGQLDDFMACRVEILNKISEIVTPQLKENGIDFLKLEVKGNRASAGADGSGIM